MQITGHFEALPGKRVPLKGESAEYSLEVVKYDKGSKGRGRLQGRGAGWLGGWVTVLLSQHHDGCAYAPWLGKGPDAASVLLSSSRA